MTMYHAVFADECGGEFGADCEASSWDEAYEKLSENYPESRIVQLESPEQARAREQETYDRVSRELDGDDWEDYDDDDY